MTALWLAVTYLVGSIPVGYLVTRFSGIDIRRRGSGNIGATNVLRTLGWLPASATLVGDVVKGYLGAWVGSRAGPSPAWLGVALLLVVVGNCWPVFLGFRGGKGVATGLGAFIMATPWAVVPAALVWVVVLATTRFVSLASLCAVAGLPVAIWALGYPGALAGAGAAVALLIVGRHRANLERLVAGTERRFGQREQTAA